LKTKPLGNRVIIQPSEAKEKTAGGIIIPDNAQETQSMGTVISVGAGLLYKGERIPLEVSINDKVIYTKYSGTEIIVDGETYLIMSESDILAKEL